MSRAAARASPGLDADCGASAGYRGYRGHLWRATDVLQPGRWVGVSCGQWTQSWFPYDIHLCTAVEVVGDVAYIEWPFYVGMHRPLYTEVYEIYAACYARADFVQRPTWLDCTHYWGVPWLRGLCFRPAGARGSLLVGGSPSMIQPGQAWRLRADRY